MSHVLDDRPMGRVLDRGRLKAVTTALAVGGSLPPASHAAPPSPGGGPAGVAGFDRASFDARFRHHTAMVNGVRLHYVIGGQGDPLVLLHGWPQTWYEWRHVMPALAERFTVIAPDLLAFFGAGERHATVATRDGRSYGGAGGRCRLRRPRFGAVAGALDGRPKAPAFSPKARAAAAAATRDRVAVPFAAVTSRGYPGRRPRLRRARPSCIRPTSGGLNCSRSSSSRSQRIGLLAKPRTTNACVTPICRIA